MLRLAMLRGASCFGIIPPLSGLAARLEYRPSFIGRAWLSMSTRRIAPITRMTGWVSTPSNVQASPQIDRL